MGTVTGLPTGQPTDSHTVSVARVVFDSRWKESSFSRSCGRGVNLTSNLHVVTRLRVSGAALLRLHVPSWHAQKRLYLCRALILLLFTKVDKKDSAQRPHCTSVRMIGASCKRRSRELQFNCRAENSSRQSLVLFSCWPPISIALPAASREILSGVLFV